MAVQANFQLLLGPDEEVQPYLYTGNGASNTFTLSLDRALFSGQKVCGILMVPASGTAQGKVTPKSDGQAITNPKEMTLYVPASTATAFGDPSFVLFEFPETTNPQLVFTGVGNVAHDVYVYRLGKRGCK